MSEALFDLLYIIDSVIRILMMIAIAIACVFFITRRNKNEQDN